MSTFTPVHLSPAWLSLLHLTQARLPSLRELLTDASRKSMHLQACGIHMDFSHQRLNEPVMQALQALAKDRHVDDQLRAMFNAEAINTTEQRSVLHMALRGSHLSNPPWGQAVSAKVKTQLDKVCNFAEKMRSSACAGFSELPMTDVVNLGIGGSDLGPRMATMALQNVADTAVRVHFVSNVDAWSLQQTLHNLNPATTAFVVQSKSFTTQETMTLAASARRWLTDAGCPTGLLPRHLIAVTAKSALALAQGFEADHVFELWDWVGGRYSIWSAIGLPLAIAIGSQAYLDMLLGACAMDAHVQSAPPSTNMPLAMALLGIWNRNFLGAESLHIAPYPACLGMLVPYLQQMDMESNGKSTFMDGSAVQMGTSPVVWGGLGIDGQHAYFQMIHQGTHLVPTDFIGVTTERTALPLAAEHHRVVVLNMKAQAQALAMGRTIEETEALLVSQGLSTLEAKQLAPHRSYPGNKPSTTLWLEAITPYSLGALMALYEHKVFYQAAIWGIHAFDQWGVELGKTLAKRLEANQ
ncbi:MAG: glucose-6-phosphate isomerase [Betaproteobacteria bacterium]|nr:glucose-6-phosphate isomerase [Betaproteobacteria bacterium]